MDANSEEGRSSQLQGSKAVQTLSVLIPVFNERWTLESIIDRVLEVDLPTEIELIIVDDRSTDGSWDLIQELARNRPCINAFQHPKNLGKGAAVRTAIERARGDFIVIQDADLEYDPQDYPSLLEPLIDDRADAVFGSRFSGTTRQVHCFWHTLVNQGLTLLSNTVNDLTLTDMETCYKMVRSDVLKQLRLNADSFTFEPELTCRLAQFGARIYEVPIRYYGRSYSEGKKIGPLDGLKAIWAIFHRRFIDTQFTTNTALHAQSLAAGCNAYSRWVFDQVEDFVGSNVVEFGSGIGNFSQFLLEREKVTLIENHPTMNNKLQNRFGQRDNVQIKRNPACEMTSDKVNTVICSHTLESVDSDGALESFHELLAPGGHCIVVTSAGKNLLGKPDADLGRLSHHDAAELEGHLKRSGFEIVMSQPVGKASSITWSALNRVASQKQLKSWHLRLFNLFFPVFKASDSILPGPGISHILVGRKTTRPEARSAPSSRLKTAA